MLSETLYVIVFHLKKWFIPNTLDIFLVAFSPKTNAKRWTEFSMYVFVEFIKRKVCCGNEDWISLVEKLVVLYWKDFVFSFYCECGHVKMFLGLCIYCFALKYCVNYCSVTIYYILNSFKALYSESWHRGSLDILKYCLGFAKLTNFNAPLRLKLIFSSVFSHPIPCQHFCTINVS